MDGALRRARPRRARTAPVVVVAAARDAARLLGARQLPLQAIGGRVSRVSPVPGLRAALAGDGTLLLGDDELLLGATFEAEGEAPLDEARAHEANLARLRRLLAQPPPVQLRSVFSGQRSTARDRQPYAGAVADEQAAFAAVARLSGAQLDDVPRRAGLFVSAAFGSRGLLLAPLAAELLAAQVEGEPWPLERPLAGALDPARFLLRALRRKPADSRRRSPCPPPAWPISSANGRTTASARAIASFGTSSSSEKSMPASTSASASTSRCRQLSARSPSRPLRCRNACRRCASVSAATRSASPSTAVRSMRPFSKARRVNSPASAGRKPSSLASAASTAAMTARPP